MATREEQRRYQREWVAKRRAAWFADKLCAWCGSVDDLRLDHIDPKRKVSNSIWSWSQARRDAELAKCQVLCEPCHKVKTYLGIENAHGTAKQNAKLDDDAVTEILRRVERGDAKRSIARDFGVSEKLVRLICLRRRWRHVEATRMA